MRRLEQSTCSLTTLPDTGWNTFRWQARSVHQSFKTLLSPCQILRAIKDRIGFDFTGIMLNEPATISRFYSD